MAVFGSNDGLAAQLVLGKRASFRFAVNVEAKIVN
jgi:hypothetical protein